MAMATAKVADKYGLGDPHMLERIDHLFACGLGELINLPQIVVIGDQSSGKSSVLAGLIRKCLPRDSGLCTRFATQIIFRRSSEETISASIIPDPNSSTEHRNEVEAWKMPDIQSLDDLTFSKMMTDVHHIMGLASSEDSLGQKPTFSNDVFRLEISGPDQEHLSVIDVPGIFQNTTQGQTTKADIELVRNMVLRYMENPRSVMLAVIPANVDVATQVILELASDVDPDGDRTLRVLTKPDLVDKGAEARVVDLVEGRARKMKLGWHIVRNLGQQQLSDITLDRQSLESDFFRTEAPWKSIDPDKVGVESLRTRIKEVLSDLVRREFPKVKQEINKKLINARKSLAEIGPERSTPHAQCAFLTDLATRFQRLVMLSISAKYGTDEVFDRCPALRFAPTVTGRYHVFSETMAFSGHTYSFSRAVYLDEVATIEDTKKPPEGWICPKPKRLNDVDETQLVAEIEALSEQHLSVKATTRMGAAEDVTDIMDILHSGTEIEATKGRGIESWLQTIYETSRGFELGTFDSSILATTMKKQSSKWCDISLRYISDVVVIVHRFIMTALDALCSDRELKIALTGALADGLAQRYQRAIDHVHFLLEVERNGTPMTTNHYFNENLEKCRQVRMQAAMNKLSFNDSTRGKLVRLEDAVQPHPMSNAKHIVQDIHDILQSYYKLARKRFVDNVLKQATDYFLLQGPDTPMGFFSPNFVNALSPEQLQRVAGEAPKMRRTRSKLDKAISSLTEAKRILT